MPSGQWERCDGAAFAAMTAIFAKLGVEQFNPDAATLIRTVVMLIVLTGVVAATHQLRRSRPARRALTRFSCSPALRPGRPGGVTSARYTSGDAARVAPLDKLSVVLVALFGVGFLGDSCR